MKIYNTLSGRIEDFKPIKNNEVNMFVCGPTVYDYAHVGHAKTYVQMDVLARTIKASGYKLNYVQNITDIDDKIITRANDQEIDWKELARNFESLYLKDMDSLRNNSVNQYIRATDRIDEIKDQVRGLLEKDLAYKISDGIYYDVSKSTDYGKLSGRTEVRENDAQSRIDQSEEKRNWNDFCIWKFSKPNEPVWEASFGDGRPGWHIEDTAITESILGPQYDVHGGAIDLIFPHHEAELSIMESLSGKTPFVKYWTHVGFMNINKDKMSKSKNNFVTIRDVIEKGYSAMALRLLILQSHYRSSMDFSWEILEAAQNRLKNWQAVADLRWQMPKHGQKSKLDFDIKRILENDLDTPSALAHIDSAFSNIATKNIASEHSSLEKLINDIDEYLGIDLKKPDISNQQKKLISDREQSRKEKNWDESDRLRDQLLEQGINIKDTDNGPVWSRV